MELRSSGTLETSPEDSFYQKLRLDQYEPNNFRHPGALWTIPQHTSPRSRAQARELLETEGAFLLDMDCDDNDDNCDHNVDS